MLQAEDGAFSAFCDNSIFPLSTKHTEKESSDPRKLCDQHSAPLSQNCRGVYLPLVQEEKRRASGRRHRRGEGGSRSRGCGVEQHMQLARCWEQFTKDTTSPLNWNPGMDSRECTGLLGQYSHNQEGKACTQSRNYSL